MSRYVTMPRAFVSSHAVPDALPSCTVFESSETPVDTGLLDISGNRLFRLPDERRIGFVVRC